MQTWEGATRDKGIEEADPSFTRMKTPFTSAQKEIPSKII